MYVVMGLSLGLGINYSCAEQWRSIAEEALSLLETRAQVRLSDASDFVNGGTK